jgi:alkanesulfonate monooxygenase SsuD/methylene tetrahydromethanopterin reductase-like flavin-dependent oxidoreductase (luciferase family)
LGGTPASFARAGALGLPLMVAIIGGETRRFRPLVDLYRSTYLKSGHDPAGMKVGLHSPGYVAESKKDAADAYYPGFAKAIASVAKERGWSPMTRAAFDAQLGPEGVYLMGSPEDVAEKILHHSKALGGVQRVTVTMNAGSMSHEKLMASTELLGSRVAPLVREAVAAEDEAAPPPLTKP